MAGDKIRKTQGARAVIGSAELCDRKFESDGDSNYDWFPVGPIFEDFGTKVVELQVHMLCREKSAGLKFKVRSQLSFDAQEWIVGEDIIAEQTASGYAIGAIYTNRAKLGRNMRFEIGVNDAGASEKGRLTAVLYWRFAT